MRYLIIMLVVALTGCNQDNECLPAYADNPHVIEDSLGYGYWEWIYTLKHVRPPAENLFYVVDTIFPGESGVGFETVDFAFGTIDNAEICFSIDGHIISGCYRSRVSSLYPSGIPTYVSISYRQWDASEHGVLGVQANLPSELEDSVFAKIFALPMFEVSEQQEETVFYRNWFVKVD
jgi:hypothetical protein